MHTRFSLHTRVAAVLLAAFSFPVLAQTRLPEVRVEGQRETPLNNDVRSESGSQIGRAHV